MLRIILFLLLAPVADLPAAETYRIVLPAFGSDFANVSAEEKQEAERLIVLAREAIEKKQAYRASELLAEAGRRDPDNETFRTIFGYQRQDGAWRTDWEIKRAEENMVDHPLFGRIRAHHVSRYENGERLFGTSRWVDKAEETRLRRHMKDGWMIETEHYSLRTNHSLEEGVRISRRMEDFYHAWKLLFLSFLYTDSQLQQAFRGVTLPESRIRHQVFLYRDKKDYVDNLKEVEPWIVGTNGYYLIARRRAYFFPVSDRMPEFEAEVTRKTFFHEGTHQLFQEVKPTSKMPGRRNNFWLAEGIAMFMETFRIVEENGRRFYVVGDIEDNRLWAAKRHRIDDRYFVPFNTLVRYGHLDFQSRPPDELPMLYSQSAAMAHFLVFGEEGRYREAVVRLLQLMYSGNDRHDSLSTLTGVSYAELDRQYFRFLDLVPDEEIIYLEKDSSDPSP